MRVCLLLLTVVLCAALCGCGIIPDAPAAPLTEEQLSALSDMELGITVLNQLDSEYGIAACEMESLSGPEQTVCAVMLFDMEVMNGGLRQYLSNTSKFTAPYLSGALLEVGAVETEALFSGFIAQNKINLNEIVETEPDYDSDYWEPYPFDAFDDVFYTLYEKEDLQALTAAYIRSHIAELAAQ